MGQIFGGVESSNRAKENCPRGRREASRTAPRLSSVILKSHSVVYRNASAVSLTDGKANAAASTRDNCDLTFQALAHRQFSF